VCSDSLLCYPKTIFGSCCVVREWLCRLSLETIGLGNREKPREQSVRKLQTPRQTKSNMAQREFAGAVGVPRNADVSWPINQMNWLSKLSRALARGVTLISPSCKEATRLQSEAMARKLSRSERVGLRMHLFLCKWCRRYGNQLKFLHSASQHSEQHESPVASQRLSPGACERIKQKLQSGRE
jgi:hypothetical protein